MKLTFPRRETKDSFLQQILRSSYNIFLPFFLYVIHFLGNAEQDRRPVVLAN